MSGIKHRIAKIFPAANRLRQFIIEIWTNKKTSREYYEPSLLEKYNKERISNKNDRLIISMVDGGKYNPGLCDKLTGILSIYNLCKKYNFKYKIYWDYPFELADYLFPNKYDWSFNKQDLDFSSSSFPLTLDVCTDPLYGKTVDTLVFRKRTSKKFNQAHVYSNTIIGKENFRALFEELFQPSENLNKLLHFHLNNIGSRYVSVSLRFMELLGDFKDQEGVSMPLPEKEANELIEKCYSKLCEIIETLPTDYKVFVASDSINFLNHVSENPRVYTIPGEIVHVRYSGSEEAYMKTFLDLLMIRNAETQYLLKTGKMYNSGFPRFASWIGNNNFKLIDF